MFWLFLIVHNIKIVNLLLKNMPTTSNNHEYHKDENASAMTLIWTWFIALPDVNSVF